MAEADSFQRRAHDLIHDEAWQDLSSLFASLHPADVADIINSAPESSHPRLFSLVGKEAKPYVLAELQTVAEADVLEAVSVEVISELISQMAPDDIADLLPVLPEDRLDAVLALMPQEDANEIRRLLKYRADTAGGIMTPDVVAMKGDQTVEDALHTIAYLETDEHFYNANVVDEDGKLIGYVDVWKLLRQRDRARPLRELAVTDVIAARTDMDQEEVGQMMSKYDLTVLPVVDAEGRLVGRVTADDAIAVIEEEASEDIFRLAGSDDSELEHPSILATCFVRLPWLLVTLFGGFLISLILRSFHSYISGGGQLESSTLALAAFVPSVLAMGGNTAIQSSTLVVRSIALGTLKGQSIARLLLREMCVGAIMGSCCGVMIGVWAGFMTQSQVGATTLAILSPHELAVIVATALFGAMSFATLFGASVPIALDRLHIDPAVASGPFVTIANDISALLIYFATTVALVRVFGA